MISWSFIHLMLLLENLVFRFGLVFRPFPPLSFPTNFKSFSNMVPS